MSDAYQVENDKPGCDCCGHGATWLVIGPYGTAHGTIYSDQDEAYEVARWMSSAFAAGRGAAFEIVTRRSGPADRRDRSKDWFKVKDPSERRKSPGLRITDDDIPF